MSDHVKFEDPADPEIQAKMQRCARAGAAAKALIYKRHRNVEPEKAFDVIANTIGILCAQMVLDAESIGGGQLSAAMRDTINIHIDRALEAVAAAQAAEQKTLN